MSEMIDRMVEVYCKAHMGCPPPEGLTKSEMSQIRLFCRAVLETIRAPTVEMVEAYNMETGHDLYRDGYRAMIDEALR